MKHVQKHFLVDRVQLQILQGMFLLKLPERSIVFLLPPLALSKSLFPRFESSAFLISVNVFAITDHLTKY